MRYENLKLKHTSLGYILPVFVVAPVSPLIPARLKPVFYTGPFGHRTVGEYREYKHLSLRWLKFHVYILYKVTMLQINCRG